MHIDIRGGYFRYYLSKTRFTYLSSFEMIHVVDRLLLGVHWDYAPVTDVLVLVLLLKPANGIPCELTIVLAI